jgi:putative transposase
MNRASGRGKLFHDDGDYAAFERVLAEAVARFAVRLCAYCLMPNHWHLVLWPRKDGELSRFMQWLTMTHTQRLHARRHSAGRGHVYQGRFKSFAAQRGEHYLALCRYVERNALRANLVGRAQDWRWCSLWRRERSSQAPDEGPVLSEWPVERPADWLAWVNGPETVAALEALGRSARRGSPYGSARWAAATAARLGVESSLRRPGRPSKQKEEVRS